MSADTQKILTCIAGWTHDGVTDDAARAELAALVEERRIQHDALMRIWYVLKKHGAHPGRTDDLIDECVDRALTALGEQRDHWMGRYKVLRESAEKAEARLAQAEIGSRQRAMERERAIEERDALLDAPQKMCARTRTT